MYALQLHEERTDLTRRDGSLRFQKRALDICSIVQIRRAGFLRVCLKASWFVLPETHMGELALRRTDRYGEDVHRQLGEMGAKENGSEQSER